MIQEGASGKKEHGKQKSGRYKQIIDFLDYI
jgi:hypothetical protein